MVYIMLPLILVIFNAHLLGYNMPVLSVSQVTLDAGVHNRCHMEFTGDEPCPPTITEIPASGSNATARAGPPH